MPDVLQRRRAGRWGVLAAVLGLALAAGAFAAVSPLNGSADEPAHVDYAYQLWHGDFPVFEDGLVLVPEGQPSPPALAAVALAALQRQPSAPADPAPPRTQVRVPA